MNFGGVDLINETAKVLKALTHFEGIHVFVIVGQANPHKEQIKQLCEAQTSWTYICQTPKIHEYILRADLAVGAGGTALWERMMLGLPSVISSIALNQTPINQALSQKGLVRYLGDAQHTTWQQYLEAIQFFRDNVNQLNRLSKLSYTFIDGQGTQKVVNQFIQRS